MKYLLAFALVAVASAATLPQPVQLAAPQTPYVSAPEPKQPLQPVQIADITPLTAATLPEPIQLAAPQTPYVSAPEPKQLLQPVQIADITPLTAATLPEPIQLAAPQTPYVSAPEPKQPLQPVQIADITPFMVPQEVMDEVALLVKFVDTAENIEAPENFAVNIVDAPVDASDYSVNFVDEAINADVPIQVRLMDTPLPDSIVMPLGQFVIFDSEIAQPVASDADLTVKFVDVADVAQETPVYMPIPRAAIKPSIEAVKIVDSPQEASDADFKVNFVDVAENIDEETPAYIPIPTEIETVKIADSLPETNEFAVKIVDLPEVDEESPAYIIKQAPLPESVVQPFEAVKVAESPLETSNDDFAVKFVDVAEENFSKQYPDPRWR